MDKSIKSRKFIVEKLSTKLPTAVNNFSDEVYIQSVYIIKLGIIGVTHSSDKLLFYCVKKYCHDNSSFINIFGN